MTIARVKNWVSEILTASDLNAEFNNILTYLNATSVVFTKVGIGMTPSNILDITQTQDTGSLVSIKNASTGTSAYAGYQIANSSSAITTLLHTGTGYTPGAPVDADQGILSTTGTGGLLIRTNIARNIIFGTNFSENMRLENTNGALLIGTTTMVSGAKLITSTTAANVALSRFNSVHATPAASVLIAAAYTASAPDDNTALFFSGADNAATRIIIYSDGDVVNHDNSYGAISKRELKQDIEAVPSLWDQLKSYPLKQYRMKEDVDKHGDNAPVRRGVVADEIKKVAPHLVKNDEYVIYSHMYMEAIAVVQELMARVEALEAKAKV